MVNEVTTIQGVPDIVEEEPVFPPFDTSTYVSQLLWLAITFGTLYYLMSKVILPRISDILEVRRDRIAGDLAEAERLNQETENAIAVYDKTLAEARQKAHDAAEDKRIKHEKKMQTRRKQVETRLTKKIEKSESEIASMREEALSNITQVAEELVGTLVTTLAPVKVTAAEVKKSVQEQAKVEKV
jgi:F-type H+-transporting ATPase subunit b